MGGFVGLEELAGEAPRDPEIRRFCQGFSALVGSRDKESMLPAASISKCCKETCMEFMI
jgi:hypothetical protein